MNYIQVFSDWGRKNSERALLQFSTSPISASTPTDPLGPSLPKGRRMISAGFEARLIFKRWEAYEHPSTPLEEIAYELRSGCLLFTCL